MPRHYQFRTLRSDFIDLCQGDRIAALLLDYFWQQGQKLAERRRDGDSAESVFIPLGWNYAISIILMPVGKNVIKRGVARLVDLRYLTPHPANGQWGANVVNRYKVNMPTIQADINRWSMLDAYVQPDLTLSGQIYPYIQPDLLNMSEQTYPLGLRSQYESVVESVIESPSSTPAAPAGTMMTMSEIDELISSLLGRRPTKLQQAQMGQMLSKYPAAEIQWAVGVAAAADARNLKYVLTCLENGRPAAKAPAPERSYYVAEPDDSVPMTPDEMRQIKQNMLALRGGAS